MLTGKHALVTGGSRGIGAAIGAALLGAGAHVTLLARNAAELNERTATLRGSGAARGVGAELQGVRADVRDEAAVADAFARAADAFGRVDILINNAGAARSASFAATTSALWNELLAVNLTGTFLCSRAAVPAMLAAGWGRIVNVASTAGLAGGRYIAAYCAAKHGVIGLTRALAIELAAGGVTANALCPGFVETGLLDESLATIVRKTGRSAAAAREALLAQSLQRRFIEPDEVAQAALWLCGPGSDAITGQSLALEASGFVA
jgi:3-hydroxybutyrate dehydrogenase